MQIKGFSPVERDLIRERTGEGHCYELRRARNVQMPPRNPVYAAAGRALGSIPWRGQRGVGSLPGFAGAALA